MIAILLMCLTLPSNTMESYDEGLVQRPQQTVYSNGYMIAWDKGLDL